MTENKHYSNNSSISKSIEKLENNLAEVPNVTAWAGLMNLCRSYFCVKFKTHFDESPSEKLCTIRYRHLQKAILNHPNETSYSIALRIGLKDDQALYKFLRRHYNTNFTEVRNKLLEDNLEGLKDY